MKIADNEQRPVPLDGPAIIPRQQGRTLSEFTSGFMLETFLYGINLMLFFVTVFILVQRYKGTYKWPLLGFAVIMFLIATANICTSIYMLFGILIPGTPIPIPIARAQHMYMFFNTSIADVLLIYRCYIVWGHSFRVIAAPCMLLLGSSLCGMIIMSEATVAIGWRKFVYLWLTLSLNMSVTLLIAVRIWWMGHQARKTLGPALARKYYSVLATVIESGAIYSLYVLLDQVLVSTKTPSFLVDAGLTQVAFAAPTLIIVQLGLGRHVRDAQTTIQETTAVLTTMRSITDPVNY